MALVYAFGSNSAGQLGVGHRDDVAVPELVLFDADHPQDVRCIAAGGNHTILLSRSGSLYAAGAVPSDVDDDKSSTVDGSGRFRLLQLAGLDPDVQATMPDVVLCAATWDATIFVRHDMQRNNTKIYSLGTGMMGELGLGPSTTQAKQAALIPSFPPEGTRIVDLSASLGHVVAVLDNGHAYGWGNGRKGQLGEPRGIIYTPRMISGIDFAATRVACGKDFTFIIEATGTGRQSLLGTNRWVQQSRPPSPPKNWVDVRACWSDLVMHASDGSLLSWGRNDHGQLPPSDLPLVVQIAAGSEHMLALTKTGTVIAWGWGEHGNCGPDAMANAPKELACPISCGPQKWTIRGVGAGCATSWIWGTAEGGA